MSAFTGMLVGISTMLAIRTGYASLEITEPEMKAWLKAAQRVARHYRVQTTQLALDWIAFTGVTAQVFGSRAVAVVVEFNAAQAEGRPTQRPGGEVRHLRPVPPAAGPGAYPGPSAPAGPADLGGDDGGGFAA